MAAVATEVGLKIRVSAVRFRP